MELNGLKNITTHTLNPAPPLIFFFFLSSKVKQSNMEHAYSANGRSLLKPARSSCWKFSPASCKNISVCIKNSVLMSALGLFTHTCSGSVHSYLLWVCSLTLARVCSLTLALGRFTHLIPALDLFTHACSGSVHSCLLWVGSLKSYLLLDLFTHACSESVQSCLL